MVMAMGGGYVGQSKGLYSLWINPAGLANNCKERVNYHKGKEITITTLSLKLQPLPYDVITVYQGLSCPAGLIHKEYKPFDCPTYPPPIAITIGTNGFTSGCFMISAKLIPCIKRKNSILISIVLYNFISPLLC
jgi:hypothetical protein